jgi:hypothetical protein
VGDDLEHLANEVVAPLLGIEPLEVATSVAEYPPRSGYVGNRDSAAWKAEVLEQRYPGRPLVWVDDAASAYRTLNNRAADDEAEEQNRASWPTEMGGTDDVARRRPWRHPHPTLVLVPDPTMGLTVAHQEAVEAFITAHG